MNKQTDNLKNVETKIGYSFKNKNLLFQAFTRRSYGHEHGGENNEIFEFIGDRVLDYYVTKILIDKYGFVNNEFSVKNFDSEGSLTKIKEQLVNKEMLAKRVEILEFKNFLLVESGDIKALKNNEPSIKEDLFEAILGAIAIDSNWNQTILEKSVIRMLDIYNYLSKNISDYKDYIGIIQVWDQKQNNKVPKYHFDKLENGLFEAHLELFTKRGNKKYVANGHNMREAKKNVAKKACDDLEKNNELFTMKDELPKNLDLNNAINTLQELAQKKYISMPNYSYNGPKYDENGKPVWECQCKLKDKKITVVIDGSSKKFAKKKAAYLTICEMFHLKPKY